MKRWTVTDVNDAVDSMLEGFAHEFFGCPWSRVEDAKAARLLEWFADYVTELRDAQNEVKS